MKVEPLTKLEQWTKDQSKVEILMKNSGRNESWKVNESWIVNESSTVYKSWTVMIIVKGMKFEQCVKV